MAVAVNMSIVNMMDMRQLCYEANNMMAAFLPIVIFPSIFSSTKRAWLGLGGLCPQAAHTPVLPQLVVVQTQLKELLQDVYH